MRIKKKVVRTFKVVFCVLACIGGGYGVYNHANSIEQITKKVTLSYDEEANRNSSFYFKGQKSEETFDASLFEFNELKDYQVNISFKGRTYTVLFHIVDKNAPTIKFSSKKVDIENGFKLSSLYKVSDKSKTVIKTNMKEEDFVEGEHNFCVTATDAYKNKTEKCTSINVKNASLVIQQPATPMKAIDKDATLNTIIKDYKKKHGITKEEVSISYHNFITNETYFDNPDQYMVAASTYKLPLNLYYYEQENAGAINPKSKLTFKPIDFEAGGPVGDSHEPGDSFKIEDLQHYSIVDSDNSASRMLFNAIGGWDAYRDIIKRYSSVSYSKEFYDNKFTARYMNDVLIYLYANSSKLPTLMKDLAKVAPGENLRMSVDVPIYQKDGNFDTAYNAAGLVYGKKPYAVAIFTALGEPGKKVIGDINNLLYQYSESH